MNRRGFQGDSDSGDPEELITEGERVVLVDMANIFV